MEIIEEALGELAKNSPLVALVIVFMIVVILMYRTSFKSIKSAYDKAFKEIQKSHAETVTELRKIINTSLPYETKGRGKHD